MESTQSGAPRTAAIAPGPSPDVPEPFRLQLSSSPRGARLARLLVERQLDTWGLPLTGRVTQAVLAVTAELASNAITHGRTPGRDFAVRLKLTDKCVRIEVDDTRPDRLLPATGSTPARPDSGAPQGRGLLLVDALAARWGCAPRDTYVKTVWAEVSL